MKILIIGGSGLLGQYLNLELSRNQDILTTYNRNTGNTKNFRNVKLDITDFASIEKIISDFQPDTVVLTAAVSNPAAAEKMPDDLVRKINVEAPGQIALQCENINATLIYTSTDLVYDGNGKGKVTEDSKLNPLTLYAETKLLGEEKIKSVTENYVILRTALLFGFGLNHSVNHFTLIYENMKKGLPVKLFYDQYRSPLALPDAAKMISEIIIRKIRGEVLNFGGNKRLSRYELGIALCEAAGFDKTLLQKVSMNDLENFIKVKDVSMHIGKLESFGIKPRDTEISIREILKSKKPS